VPSFSMPPLGPELPSMVDEFLNAPAH